jgi:hypothetical protein
MTSHNMNYINNLRERNRWTELDVITLADCYKSYPFVIDTSLIERHGKAGCYTKAKKMGFAHRLRSGIPNVESWSETTKAYLAGIIDGEGTITIIKNNRKQRNGKEYFYSRPVVTVANTSYSLLDYLTSLGIGGFSTDKRKVEGQKQAFQWCLSSVNAVYTVLKAIYPYLVIKKDRADEVMSWIGETWKDEPNLMEMIQ